jgi:TRAP-type uncharacterized transport system fused permease subunit
VNQSQPKKSPKRNPSGPAKWLIFAAAVGLALFHLYTAAFGVLSPLYQRSVHLMGLLLICVLFYRLYPGQGKSNPGLMDWGFALASAAVGIYMITSFAPEAVLDRGIMGPTQEEIWVGIALVALILEGTRRSVGMPIVLVAVAFLAYGCSDPICPNSWPIRGMAPNVW